MITPIDKTNANQRICPTFRPVLEIIRENYIQPQENIFAVACCTHMHKYRLDYGKESLRMSEQPSIVVISNHRWIRAGFRKMPGKVKKRKEVSYRKSGSGVGSLFGGDYFEWKWVEYEVDYSGVDDVKPFIWIREVPLSDLKVTHRFEYKVDFEKQPLALVEIVLNNTSWVAFRESDGNAVYRVLQEAAKNKGRIQITQEYPTSDPIESLKKLKDLLELGLVTQKEYELKRQDILARL